MLNPDRISAAVNVLHDAAIFGTVGLCILFAFAARLRRSLILSGSIENTCAPDARVENIPQ